MRLETVIAATERDYRLCDLPQSFSLDPLTSGDGPWEVELGFGKGRYLLRKALEHPDRRFLGVELVSKYYRLLRDRARRQDASNLLVVRGEALYLLTAVLPSAFASRLHIYFPDPWPKGRHFKRRLLDPESLDLVLGVLQPGGELCFATDFIDYGQRVCEILEGYPGLAVQLRHTPWPDGARTNYEAKYMLEGRPILRLTARWTGQPSDLARGDRVAGASVLPLHPRGRIGVLAATSARFRSDSCPAVR